MKLRQAIFLLFLLIAGIGGFGMLTLVACAVLGSVAFF